MQLGIFDRYRDIIDDWDAFTETLQRPLHPVIWANTLRTNPDRLAEWLEEDGIAARPLDWYPKAFRLPAGTRPGRSLAFLTGQYHVQEEVSLLPVKLLDPQPGEQVLDLCAAPGNKSVQMAVHMGNQGTVVANDRSHRRISIALRNIERLGVTCIAAQVANAAQLPKSFGLYDRVLADVPCNCEGTTRKNPEVLMNNRMLPGTQSAMQRAILRKAVQKCKPGGRIVYSTCTYAPEENEEVVNAVLGEQGSTLEVLPAQVDGFESSPGLTQWNGQRLDRRLQDTMRVFPHHNDTGGFYIAVLEKAS